jgi:hypothetical protein
VSLAGFRVLGFVGAGGVTSLINGTLSLCINGQLWTPDLRSTENGIGTIHARLWWPIGRQTPCTCADVKSADPRSEHALEQAISQQAVLNEVLTCQRNLLVYTEQVRTKRASHYCRTLNPKP